MAAGLAGGNVVGGGGGPPPMVRWRRPQRAVKRPLPDDDELTPEQKAAVQQEQMRSRYALMGQAMQSRQPVDVAGAIRMAEEGVGAKQGRSSLQADVDRLRSQQEKQRIWGEMQDERLERQAIGAERNRIYQEKLKKRMADRIAAEEAAGVPKEKRWEPSMSFQAPGGDVVKIKASEFQGLEPGSMITEDAWKRYMSGIRQFRPEQEEQMAREYLKGKERVMKINSYMDVVKKLQRELAADERAYAQTLPGGKGYQTLKVGQMYAPPNLGKERATRTFDELALLLNAAQRDIAIASEQAERANESFLRNPLAQPMSDADYDYRAGQFRVEGPGSVAPEQLVGAAGGDILAPHPSAVFIGGPAGLPGPMGNLGAVGGDVLPPDPEAMRLLERIRSQRENPWIKPWYLSGPAGLPGPMGNLGAVGGDILAPHPSADFIGGPQRGPISRPPTAREILNEPQAGPYGSALPPEPATRGVQDVRSVQTGPYGSALPPEPYTPGVQSVRNPTAADRLRANLADWDNPPPQQAPAIAGADELRGQTPQPTLRPYYEMRIGDRIARAPATGAPMPPYTPPTYDAALAARDINEPFTRARRQAAGAGRPFMLGGGQSPEEKIRERQAQVAAAFPGLQREAMNLGAKVAGNLMRPDEAARSLAAALGAIPDTETRDAAYNQLMIGMMSPDRDGNADPGQSAIASELQKIYGRAAAPATQATGAPGSAALPPDVRGPLEVAIAAGGISPRADIYAYHLVKVPALQNHLKMMAQNARQTMSREQAISAIVGQIDGIFRTIIPKSTWAEEPLSDRPTTSQAVGDMFGLSASALPRSPEQIERKYQETVRSAAEDIVNEVYGA